METIGVIFAYILLVASWTWWSLSWAWTIVSYPATFNGFIGFVLSITYLFLLFLAYNRFAPMWIKRRVNEIVLPQIRKFLKKARNYIALQSLDDEERQRLASKAAPPQVIYRDKVAYQRRSWKGVLVWMSLGAIIVLIMQNLVFLISLFSR